MCVHVCVELKEEVTIIVTPMKRAMCVGVCTVEITALFRKSDGVHWTLYGFCMSVKGAVQDGLFLRVKPPILNGTFSNSAFPTAH